MAGGLRVTILGAAVAVAAFGMGGSKCSAQDVGASANLNVDVDVNALTNTITQAISSAANRNGVVKQIMNAAYYQTNQRYNVMVFNLNQNYDASGLVGVKYYKNVTYDPTNSNIPFGVWVFESGTFVNQGDGGYINWCFGGSFKRSGQNNQTVTFSKISKPTSRKSKTRPRASARRGR